MLEGGPELAGDVREGDILAGKYRVERVLGAGGMGVVLAARHLQLETRVAIKLLLPSMLGSEEAVARFAREARAAVRITSEHVARVFDVGTLDSGAPYIVMEFLEGEDLAALVRRRGALDVEQAVDFVLQACIAVAEAHGLGIVHRDLKPANLFCVRRADGQLVVKVLDFGISKMVDATTEGMSVTTTTTMMGSPLYMSPEQMASPKGVDSATDIWALGVILYELLTGRVPFVGETLPDICVKIATQAPRAPRELRPDLPRRIEAAILRCLEKDRSHRYRSVAELAASIADFGSPQSRASVERISGIQSARQTGGTTLAAPTLSGPSDAPWPGTISPVGHVTGRRTSDKGRGRVWILLGAAAAVLLATVAVGYQVAAKGGAAMPAIAGGAGTNATGSASNGGREQGHPASASDDTSLTPANTGTVSSLGPSAETSPAVVANAASGSPSHLASASPKLPSTHPAARSRVSGTGPVGSAVVSPAPAPPPEPLHHPAPAPSNPLDLPRQ